MSWKDTLSSLFLEMKSQSFEMFEDLVSLSKSLSIIKTEDLSKYGLGAQSTSAIRRMKTIDHYNGLDRVNQNLQQDYRTKMRELQDKDYDIAMLKRKCKELENELNRAKKEIKELKKLKISTRNSTLESPTPSETTDVKIEDLRLVHREEIKEIENSKRKIKSELEELKKEIQPMYVMAQDKLKLERKYKELKEQLSDIKKMEMAKISAEQEAEGLKKALARARIEYEENNGLLTSEIDKLRIETHSIKKEAYLLDTHETMIEKYDLEIQRLEDAPKNTSENNLHL